MSFLDLTTFETHQKFYQQPDSHNCGIFSLINVSAAYVAEATYHQNWLDIRLPHDFFLKILKPYWLVADGGKMQKKELMIRAQWFRYNFILLCEYEAPNNHYLVGTDPKHGTYWLKPTQWSFDTQEASGGNAGMLPSFGNAWESEDVS